MACCTRLIFSFSFFSGMEYWANIVCPSSLCPLPHPPRGGVPLTPVQQPLGTIFHLTKYIIRFLKSKAKKLGDGVGWGGGVGREGCYEKCIANVPPINYTCFNSQLTFSTNLN